MSNKINVLVVDDEPFMIGIWQDAFKILNHNVFTAANGNEAVDVLKDKSIDLVITDIRMPVADGRTVLKYLKHNASNIKTVVSTGFMEEDIINSEFKVDHFIYKPFDLMNEIDALSKIIDEI